MNVLVTGANGYVGSNIISLLSDQSDLVFFKGTRQTIDLYSKDSIYKYLNTNKIDAIVHCAIEGGRRIKGDSIDVLYKNILMLENLTTSISDDILFINIGSGAAYDRRRSIGSIKESNINSSVPVDYYGLSKNIVSKRLLSYKNAVDLIVFGLFYHNEADDRFIKSNLVRYINKTPMQIFQDKYMSFFYMEDFANVVKKYLYDRPHLKCPSLFKVVNMEYYAETKRLHEISDIINTLDNRIVPIKTETRGLGNSYSGNGYRAICLDVPFKGLKLGIRECYNKLKF